MFSNIKGVLEEVEKISESDVLKKIIKTLLRENLILSRRTNTALKSLENQNILINYLQKTLISLMARNAMQANELWAVLGSETLRTFDDVVRYQLLIHEIGKRNKFGEEDKRIVEELKNIAFTVPDGYVEAARAKCISFLDKIKKRVSDDNHAFGTEIPTQKTTRTSKFQNGKVSIFPKNRKQQYKEMAKKKACSTSQKPSFNKPQNSKSENNNSRKNFRHAKLSNSAETSQSDRENVQSKKVTRRRNLKRKAVEMNGETSSNLEEENLTPINKPTVKKTELTRKVRKASNYSNSNSIDEGFQLKSLVIELNDFMTDPSADNDQYIARYKQANGYRDNEEIDFVVVESDDDVNSEKKEDSDHISDNSDDENKKIDKIISIEDNNKEQELAQSKLIVDEDNDAVSKDERRQRTPSPIPEGNIPRRGPRTPSLSPPVMRRGPCTPPGAAPTSDSEGISSTTFTSCSISSSLVSSKF